MYSSFSGSFARGRRPSISIGSPLSITSGTFWFDGSDGSATQFGSTLADGATVTTWKDLYTASHDANNSGNSSIKPIWKSNIQNGLGVVRFDGINDSLNINPIAFLDNLSSFTIFIIARPSQLGTVVRPLSGTDTNSFRIQHDGSNWQVTAAGGTGISSVAGDTTNFHQFVLAFDGTQIGNANRLRFRHDRVEQTLDYGATTVGTNIGTGSYVYFGRNAASNWFAGDMAELVMFTRLLSSLEILQLENYFQSRWNLA